MTEPSKTRRQLIAEAECAVALCLLNEGSGDPSSPVEPLPSLFFIAQAALDELYRTRYLQQRLPVPKSRSWVDSVLPELDEDRFRVWVRMDRTSFAYVHNLISSSPIFGSSSRSPQAPVAEQLAIALHKLGTNGSGAAIRVEAGHWGQSEGHIVNCTRRVCLALTEMVKTWIVWPGARERALESSDSQLRSGLVSAIGKVDATDIVLHERPGGSMKGEEFFNRKKRYALNLTAVCDRNLRFTFVSTGWPGSVHDSRVWANSDVVLRPQQYFSRQEYLIGDSAYPCNDHLVAPYKRPLSRVPDNKKFNKALSSVRIDIEHAFGLLKGRWASLKGLRLRITSDDHLEGACRWILACCVLHNILLCIKDDWVMENDAVDEQEAGGEDDGEEAAVEGRVYDERRKEVQVDVLSFLRQ